MYVANFSDPQGKFSITMNLGLIKEHASWTIHRFNCKFRAKKIDLAKATHEDAAVLAAIAEAGDPELERARGGARDEGPSPHQHAGARPGHAARAARRSLAEQAILAELDHAFFARRHALLQTLSNLPDVLAHAATLPTLTPGDRLVLLAETCDPARRHEAQDAAAGLSDGANPILRELNACLDRRERTMEIRRTAVTPDRR